MMRRWGKTPVKLAHDSHDSQWHEHEEARSEARFMAFAETEPRVSGYTLAIIITLSGLFLQSFYCFNLTLL